MYRLRIHLPGHRFTSEPLTWEELGRAMDNIDAKIIDWIHDYGQVGLAIILPNGMPRIQRFDEAHLR